MTLIVGTSGKVQINGIQALDVERWELHEEVKPHVYFSSQTGPDGAVLITRPRLRGQCLFRLNETVDLINTLAPGSTVQLQLELDPTRLFTISALVVGYELLKSIDQGDPDRLRVHFINTGPWSRPS